LGAVGRVARPLFRGSLWEGLLMLLTTKDLISRMSPATMASLLADLAQWGNQDAYEKGTVRLVREVLECNVGAEEADKLIAEMSGIKA
jgi:hypothetical protein